MPWTFIHPTEISFSLWDFKGLREEKKIPEPFKGSGFEMILPNGMVVDEHRGFDLRERSTGLSRPSNETSHCGYL